MSSMTIRNLDPALKERLRVRAAEHGHSMEAEARDILREGLAARGQEETIGEFFQRIHARFAALGGVKLELPSRDEDVELPQFD